MRFTEVILYSLIFLFLPITAVYSADKPKYNGVYVIKNNEKIEVIKAKKELKYHGQTLSSSYILYGFESKQYRTFIDTNEFNQNGLFIKGMGHFKLKMGKNSSIGRDKFFCHSSKRVSLFNGVTLNDCKGGTTGRGRGRDKIMTTFDVKAVGNGVKRYKPRNKLRSGHYFFWLDNGSNSFSKGYPLILK